MAAAALKIRRGPAYAARPLSVTHRHHDDDDDLLDTILAKQQLSPCRDDEAEQRPEEGSPTDHQSSDDESSTLGAGEAECPPPPPPPPLSTTTTNDGDEQGPSRRTPPTKRSPEDPMRAKNAALAASLKQKTEQLKRMQILLEGLSPVPGVSAERLLNAVDGEGPCDARDRKIVQLARKSRNLSVALQREREESKRLRGEAETLSTERDDLAARLAEAESRPMLLALPGAPQQDATTQRQHTSSRREQQLGKQIAELRAHLQRSRDETLGLKRTLAKEVGDAASYAADGWRGRAQQIVMLKAKVRKLEHEAQQQQQHSLPPPGDEQFGGGGGPQGPGQRRAAAARRRRQGDDVDERAQRELAEMEKERQRSVEELTERHAALETELGEARRKVEAGKARTESLVAECSRTKEHVRLLLDKTEGDNDLVDALRDQVATLQNQLIEARRRKRDHDGPAVRDGSQEVELTRLRRHNARLELLLERKSLELASFAAARAAPAPVAANRQDRRRNHDDDDDSVDDDDELPTGAAFKGQQQQQRQQRLRARDFDM